jgi:nickel-dependent lactate racemase
MEIILKNHQKEEISIYQLPYGRESVSFSLPEHTSVKWLDYKSTGKKTDYDQIQHALASPIGSPPLHELARNKQNAVILISDQSRLCPSDLFLGSLLNELNTAGLADGQIKIIVALGMHRKQTEQELCELVGEPIYKRINTLNHSSLQEDCVRMGTTSRGTPIEINAHVAAADIVIATGNIEPHRLTGTSGGIKALIPGVASHLTIESNHALSQQYQSTPGQVNSPLREDLEEALRFIPVHFLFNLVINHNQEILGAFAGDIILAHRAGSKIASDCFFPSTSETYDLIIASAGGFPKDLQLYQAIKSLQNASEFLSPGGCIVWVACCEEMFGNGLLQYWVETIQNRDRITQMLQEKFILGPHKILTIQPILQKHRVYLFSDMPKSLVTLLGFKPIEDLQETVLALMAENPKQAVAIFPHAALTFMNLNDANHIGR